MRSPRGHEIEVLKIDSGIDCLDVGVGQRADDSWFAYIQSAATLSMVGRFENEEDALEEAALVVDEMVAAGFELGGYGEA